MYVADTAADRLVVLDGWEFGIVRSIPVDDAPYDVAVDERHARLYVSSPGAGTVSAFGLHTGELLYRWYCPGLGYVYGIAADEVTGNLFVTYALAPKYGGLVLLDGRDGTILAETRGNRERSLLGAYDVAVDSVRRRFYATDYGHLLTFDADDGRLLGVLPGVEIAYPFSLTVDEVGGTVYVAGGGGVQAINDDPVTG